MDLTIEMSLDSQVLARSGYTLLDVISDVGGIQGLLMSLIGVFLGVFNFRNFDNYLASRLFKVVKKSDKDAKENTAKNS